MPILLPERGDVTGFGDFLRDARERRGLTLQQISAETKIPWRHLDALEHGNFAAVPSGMYRRAEIRRVRLGRRHRSGPRAGRAGARARDGEQALGGRGEGGTALPEAARSPHGAQRSRRRPGDWWSSGCSGAGYRPGSSDGATVTAATPAAPAPAAAAPSAPQGAAAPVVDAADVSAPTAASTPPAPIAPASPTEDVLAADSLPAATAGELIVITKPQGARVIVDDIGRGSAPATIRHLAAGTKRIRVIKDGYVSEERVISFSPGRGQTIAIALQPAR